mgnify:CR=1 FL=1
MEVLLYSLLVQDRIRLVLDIMVRVGLEEHIIYTVILVAEAMAVLEAQVGIHISEVAAEVPAATEVLAVLVEQVMVGHLEQLVL